MNTPAKAVTGAPIPLDAPYSLPPSNVLTKERKALADAAILFCEKLRLRADNGYPTFEFEDEKGVSTGQGDSWDQFTAARAAIR